ncbi:MAG: hypothetical protein R3A48_20285 [Polyangiales bacterium]
MTLPDADLREIRAAVERALRAAGEDTDASTGIAEEIQPFAEAAARRARDDDESAARELRSVAWLLAYRAGDQGLTALSLEALLRAWAERAEPAAAATLAGVRDLVTDGFARGREDRARAEHLRVHAESIPLITLAPRAHLLVAAEPLDAAGAELVAERVGASLLRAEARAILLHLHALSPPRLDVLAALWGIASSARMLGCACVVSGARQALTEALEEGALPREPAVFVDDEAAAVHEVIALADGLVGAVPAPLRWMRGRR